MSDFLLQPTVLVPQDFDLQHAQKVSDYDPGICSCPACRQYYFDWGGQVFQCIKCGFIFPTDAWAMYSWGCWSARTGRTYHNEERMRHAYYRYGYEHPLRYPQSRDEFDRLDWRSIVGDWPNSKSSEEADQ